MKILMAVLFASILGANIGYAQHKFPSEKYYRRMCESGKFSCCDAIDPKCADVWELWIYFPQGINFCEKSMIQHIVYHKEGGHTVVKVEKYGGYCVGYPDPDTKDVQISECPEHWPDNPDATLRYTNVLLPGGLWYNDNRYFGPEVDDDVMISFGIGGYSFGRTTPGRLKEIGIIETKDDVDADDLWSDYETPAKMIPFDPKTANQMACQYKNPNYKPLYPPSKKDD